MTSSSATDAISLHSLSSFLRRKVLRHISCGSSKKRRPAKQDPPWKFKKLVDLLHLAEIHERREVDLETRRKADALERMKEVVKDLQSRGDDGESKKREGAVSVWLLSKEDGEARSLLAMLGAIPPLIGMIDSSSDDDAKINALYALLNLGIGNDA